MKVKKGTKGFRTKGAFTLIEIIISIIVISAMATFAIASFNRIILVEREKTAVSCRNDGRF